MSTIPANLYGQTSIPVGNFNFEASAALPPPNWIPTNSATLSYDTTTPYEGLRSLVVTSAILYGSAYSLQQFPITPGNVYQISAAMKVVSGGLISAQLVFVDINGFAITPRPNLQCTSSSWLLATSTPVVAPFNAVSAFITLEIDGVSGGVGEFDVIQVSQATANSYYLGLLTSEYQDSPKFQSLLSLLLQPFIDMAVCAESIPSAFSVASAVGHQLDVIGQLVGVSRVLPFSPGIAVNTTTSNAVTTTGSPVTIDVGSINGMFPGLVVSLDTGINQENVSIGSVSIPGVSFITVCAKTHLSGVAVTYTPSAVLIDSDFRVLIQAKILQNQWNGQAGSLWQPWQTIFPGGHIYITDNQNMTCTVFLIGSFSPIQQQMITNGLIVPRPQGVQYTYTFGTLPFFGFDSLNPTFVAGFDTGRWD